MTTDRSRPTKALATRIAPELASHLEPVLMHDSSTNTLIRHYRTNQGRARLKDTVMSLGYNRPLYLLPFDHRHSYVTGMFHFTSTADCRATRSRRRQQAGDLRRIPPGARHRGADSFRRHPGRRGIRRRDPPRCSQAAAT